jgi:hypothetical protein
MNIKSCLTIIALGLFFGGSIALLLYIAGV